MRYVTFLTLPLALLLHSFAAGAAEDLAAHRALRSPETASLQLPFSDAVLVGDTLYLSGSGGIDTTTMQVPEDPREEARLMMENVKAALALADMTVENLVSVTVYCTDLSLYETFNDVYSSYFSDYFPARAFIGANALVFGMRFEIQATAARQATRPR